MKKLKNILNNYLISDNKQYPIYILKLLLMKTTKLNFLWKTYELEIIKDKYENNRTYLWLIDKSDNEYFSDISINDPRLDINENEILINKDFQNCFKDNNELYQWIKENFDIKSWWINNWYYTFTI